MKAIRGFLAALLLMVLVPFGANAANFTNSITGMTVYDSGCLKSLSLVIDADITYAEAYGRIAIHTQQSKYGWNNRYTYDGTASWPDMPETGFLTWGSGDEFLWSDGAPHPVTVNFQDNVVNLKADGTYYVYLWTRSTRYGIYPDALVYTLTSSGDGTLKDNQGNSYHEHSWSYSANGNVISAICAKTGCANNTTALTLTLTANDATYTGKSNAASVSNKITAVTDAQPDAVQYSGTAGTSYGPSDAPPTDAGSYVASVSLGGQTATKSFSIGKAGITPIVSLAGWTYGNTPGTPVISGNTGNGAVSYAYKKAGAADSAYGSSAPTDAGSYTVKAMVAETANYKAGQCTADFAISPRSVTVSGIRAEDKTYDGSTAARLDFTDAKLNGKLDGDDLSVTATSGVFDKADAGQNRTVSINGLTLTGDAKANYVLSTASQTTTTAGILPKSICVSFIGADAHGGTYGGTITPAQAETVDHVAGHQPAVALTYENAKDNTVVYGPGGTVPTDAGHYTVTASVADPNYALQSDDDHPVTVDFVVWQSTTALDAQGRRLMINGEERTEATLTYGDALTVVVSPGATGQSARQTYRLLRMAAPSANQMALYLKDGDGEKQLTAPADPSGGVYTLTCDTADKALRIGENTLIARFAGNPNMAAAEISLTITLERRELTVTGLTLQARDYAPGDRTVAIVEAELAGIEGDDDVAVDPQRNLCTLDGEDSGEYARVTLPGTVALRGLHAGYYVVGNAGQALSARASVHKAPLDLQVSLENWVEGQKAQTPVVTGNLGGGAETFRYSRIDAKDAQEQKEPPVRSGRYLVKASVPETANYLAGEATAEFEVYAAPPQTGDGSRLGLWLGLCLLACCGLLAAVLRRRRK